MSYNGKNISIIRNSHIFNKFSWQFYETGIFKSIKIKIRNVL